MNATDFINAIKILEKEKGISVDLVIESLKEALEKAYKKNYDTNANIEVMIDAEKGTIDLIEKKVVVDNLDDEETEIFIEEAQEIDPKYQVGDIIETKIYVDDFSRLAATHVKQVVRQKIREVEKTIIYDTYVHQKDDIIVGTVDRVEPNFAIIDLGQTGGLLPIANQIPGERLSSGSKIKVYVVDVDKSAKGAQVIVSRADSGFIKRLFEAEVPDVYDGTVVIKSIAREAGDRAKMSVYATKDDVDAVGACIGPKGTIVKAVSDEVHGEKIDIVEYDEDPVKYITNTLAPSKVISVNFDEENRSAVVVVPDDQLSLAIGKKGQNVRLAVRLTGFKIDIKPLSEAKEQGLEILYNGNVDNQESKPKAVKKAKKVQDLPEVSIEEFEEEAYYEDDKPVVDIDTLLQDIREAAPVKKVKIKKEKTTKKKEDEEEITFLDVEKPKEEPVVPIYTEEELEAIKKEEEAEKEFVEDFYDDIDYDEFDKYYEE